jgi:hypothetical protein
MDATVTSTSTSAFRRRVGKPLALGCTVIAVSTLLLATIGGSVAAERSEPEDTGIGSVVADTDSPVPPPALARPRVSVIGDSITFLSEGAIHAALDSDHDVVVNGIPGIKVAGQLAAARQAALERPDVVVINLGTNDVLSQREPADVTHDLQATASEFGPTSCVVFVNLTTLVSNADFEQRATAVNRWISGQFHVADWNSVVTEAGPLANVTTDTVHPTEHGQALLAQLIRQQVDACTA